VRLSTDPDSMSKLTEEVVIQIHDFLIEETGGLPGVRDPGALYFLVRAINAETDVLRKAAIALFLADRHPFWDGQKRTAFELADSFLREAGYYFDRSDKERIEKMMKRIAEYECPEGEEVEAILKWVRKVARKAT
jgi:death-on-curing protein